MKTKAFFCALATTVLLTAGCAREAQPPPTPTPKPKPALESRVEVLVFLPQTTLAVGDKTMIVVHIENTSPDRTINFDSLRVSLPTNFLTAFVVTEVGDFDIDPGVLGRLQGIYCPDGFSIEPGRLTQFSFPAVAKVRQAIRPG